MSDGRHIVSFDELADVFAKEAAFAAYPVATRGDGFIEIKAGEGGLLFCEPHMWKDVARLEKHLISREVPNFVLLLGTDADFEEVAALRERIDLALVTLPLSRARLLVNIKNYCDLVALKTRSHERGRLLERYRYELGEVIATARAISSERDIDKLLGLILEKTRYITGADAGSVYIVEGRGFDARERTLRFRVSQNDSLKIDFREFTLPVDERSIVGRAVLSRNLINIPDLYRLEEEGRNPWGFRHDKQFDKKTGYQGRSMLTVPMLNQSDEVIGVIQLINKKKEGAPGLSRPEDFERWVVPFDNRAEELSATLAAQAGISLENTLLYEDIRKLFEGFVNASVTAIESRDPTTSGHSQRVATLTVGLAELIDRENSGTFSDVRFSADDLQEIRYAGLLHDFGKVGVAEHVLVKAKKLYDHQREAVLSRFDFIRKSIEAEGLRRRIELMKREGVAEAEHRFHEIDEDNKKRLLDLDEYVAFIMKSNEPTVLAEGSFEKLTEISQLTYVDPRGVMRPFLTTEEVAALSLPRGSLTTEERLEIESHVVHTFNFLENIPWGRKLGAIPLIAASHHEKLDGTGYPRGLRGEDIRIESRMMAIADIFDALTASDRPYKKAVPVDRALGILEDEVKRGKCDRELFDIFVGGKLWTLVIPSS